MVIRHYIAVAVIVIMCAFAGCSKQAAQTPSAQAPPNSPTATGVPLPEWAPKDPSPEFLRAARVLKPLPPEMLVEYAQGDKAKEAEIRRNMGAWPAHYEFFGTLTDEQIQHFLSKKQIRIPVRSLTPKQRAAMERFFSEWRRVMKGTEYPDFLVLLYKFGAKEDLSNVEVGFDAHSGVIVHVKFWVRSPGGEVHEPCNAFACI